MIKLGSVFFISDNSGVKKIETINNLTKKNVNNIFLGDLIVGVVKDIHPKATIMFSTIIYCIVIRLRKTEINVRKEYNISFNCNSAVVVNRNLDLIGSRIFGSVPKFLKEKNYLKLHTLSLDLV